MVPWSICRMNLFVDEGSGLGFGDVYYWQSIESFACDIIDYENQPKKNVPGFKEFQKHREKAQNSVQTTL
jgi:hypothetical protein